MVVAAILIFSTPCGHRACSPCWPMNAYEGQIQAEMVVISTSLLPPFIGHIMFICLAKLFVPDWTCLLMSLMVQLLEFATEVSICFSQTVNTNTITLSMALYLKVNRLTSNRSHASRNHQDRKPFPVVIAKYYQQNNMVHRPQREKYIKRIGRSSPFRCNMFICSSSCSCGLYIADSGAMPESGTILR